MRPIRKQLSPVPGDFDEYSDAKPDLISRLGMYCSYCERPVSTNLAVEHIEPKKGPHGQPHLTNRWENFLLACVNCNSTKGDKKVDLQNLLLPDRDNTSAAFVYRKDGNIDIHNALTQQQATLAENTLKLVGLDKPKSVALDANGKEVALDRVSQRMQAHLLAERAKDNLTACNLEPMRKQIVDTAFITGYFSIWMAVFDGEIDMKLRFVNAFKGTKDSECFNHVNADLIMPAPNPDSWSNGSKV
ncbi:HNH endonuclease [Marinobacter sp. ELB17]|uniref:HNH endonuclease n=1 Tax=Marinobacter sp. ELB17 TaxID=270374 RepID=UPI0000F36D50|nr:HNH endonuclease [Marinobacter sp. ELB17]EBA01739.1 hypothetical protein MELB17_03135 [Marinobacter sp. ELB17]